MRTRFVIHGWLAHFFISFISFPLNAVTGAKKSLTALSFNCLTISYVRKRNEGLPSVIVWMARVGDG